MRSFLPALALAALSLPLAASRMAAQITPPRLVRAPAIYGDKIAFSAEGDIWIGSLAQHFAYRLTTSEGTETTPRFSPDGTQIAFTGQYDGNTDVYVMPTAGGAPKRLTYDPTGAEMVAWTPDGKSILFRSSRSAPLVGPRLFSVKASGGAPTPLPMERAAQAAYSPDGTRLAFCRLPGTNNWKRYRGGQANHIWLADLNAKQFKRIDNDTINEQYPVWIGGNVYYVSEHDGTANLWRYDTRSGKHTRLTNHDQYDVKSPSTDGKTLIYEWGNSLYTYDPAAGKETQVKLALASDSLHARVHTLPGTLGGFGTGPTGKRLVVEGRGQIFTVPSEKGEIRKIAPSLGSRNRAPVWSPDGKIIAFISDRSGEENVWLASTGATGGARQLTQEAGIKLRTLLWSPDSKTLALTDGANRLWLLDAVTGRKTLVKESQYGGVGDAKFSPDSKWLVYDHAVNYFVQSIFLYNIALARETRLTFPPTRDHDPVFDPTGKYLVFLSERNLAARNDAVDFQTNFTSTTKIYLLTLAKDTPSPAPVETDEEPGNTPVETRPVAPKPDTKPTTPSPAPTTRPVTDAINPAVANPSAASPAAPVTVSPAAVATPNLATTTGVTPAVPDVKVDLDGLSDRIMELGVAPGNYRALNALMGRIVFVSLASASDDDSVSLPGGVLKAYELAGKKTTTLGAGVAGYDLSADGKKMAVRTVAGLQVVDAGTPITPAAPRVDLSAWRVDVDPPKEWNQIFEEAWRQHRDIFYDANLHGQDWNAVRRKYQALLPAIGSRADLNAIIADMQGEMNVSHEFVGGGYDIRRAIPGQGMGGLGADLTWNPTANAYQFTRIFAGDGFDFDARSPLLMPGLNIKPGDYLWAINGAPLKGDEDPSAQLVGQGGKIVTLSVSDKPNVDAARTVRIKTLASETQARYYEWTGKNRKYVQQYGGANLAYIHVPDMQGYGMQEFSKQFYANLDKDGMVIDVRYNNGGITSGQILERLKREIFEYDQPRYGMPEPYHRTAYIGRIVVLCNERTSSDGEYFCTGLRAMKLGPTVGTRTWGGFMAVGGFPTLDGGSVSTPVEGSFTPQGKWLPDGYGFNPDYVIDEDPNQFVQGRDPQMDKALEILKAEIKKDPPHWPTRIAPPSQEKAFAPNKK